MLTGPYHFEYFAESLGGICLILGYGFTAAAASRNEYRMSGNKISVRTLDLNCDFSEIATQLNKIVTDYFNL